MSSSENEEDQTWKEFLDELWDIAKKKYLESLSIIIASEEPKFFTTTEAATVCSINEQKVIIMIAQEEQQKYGGISFCGIKYIPMNVSDEAKDKEFKIHIFSSIAKINGGTKRIAIKYFSSGDFVGVFMFDNENSSLALSDVIDFIDLYNEKY